MCYILQWFRYMYIYMYICIHTHSYIYVCVSVCVDVVVVVVIVQLLSHIWLCDSLNCSTLGFPILHYFLKFVQTHIHWVGDTIQPSHPLSPLLLLPSIFPSIRVSFNESALCIRWPKKCNFDFNISPSNEYSGLISFWSCSPRDSQESSSAPQFKSIYMCSFSDSFPLNII